MHRLCHKIASKVRVREKRRTFRRKAGTVRLEANRVQLDDLHRIVRLVTGWCNLLVRRLDDVGEKGCVQIARKRVSLLGCAGR